MPPFDTMTLPAERTVVAPDGSDVRALLGLAGGAFAHFELAAGATSRAVRHRTVEEIWYVLAGHGEMWRSQDGREEVVQIGPDTCLTIPHGTSFQFRAFGEDPLSAVAVTMPLWPGEEEAVLVDGYPPWAGDRGRSSAGVQIEKMPLRSGELLLGQDALGPQLRQACKTFRELSA